MEGKERAGTRRTSGTRRGRVLGIFVVLALGAAALPALAGAIGDTDTPTPNRDINSYAVFGWDSVAIKGKSGARINGGNVGVDAAGGQVNICVNGELTMGPGTQLVGDYLSVSTLCRLHDVFYGPGHRPPTLNAIPHHGDNTFSAPINPTNVPAFPTDARCDGTKPIVRTPTAGPYDLAPGTYGNLTIKDGSPITLMRLTSGSYTFCDVNIGRDVWLDLEATTKVIVTGTFSISNESAIGHAPGNMSYNGVTPDTAPAQFFVRGDRAEVAHLPNISPCRIWSQSITAGDCDSGYHVNFSKHTFIRASFFARNGRLNLGHDTDLFGKYWAKAIISDLGTRIEVPPCCTTGNTTTTAPTTTTIKPTTTSTSTTSTTRATTTTTTTRPPITTTSTSTTTTTRPTTTTTSTTIRPTTTTIPGT